MLYLSNAPLNAKTNIFFFNIKNFYSEREWEGIAW